MKVRLRIIGESYNEITERAEEMAQHFAGDLPRVVKYAEGWTDEVDTRQGVRHSFPRAQDMKLVFVVPVSIEVGDEPAFDEGEDE